MEEIEILKQAIKREKLARKEAEAIMEAKSLELYESNQKLMALNQNLEFEIEKRTEEIARKVIEFKRLVESATEFIFRISLEGNFTYINPVMIKVSGFTEKELIGQHFTTFIHPDYVDSLEKLYLNQIAQLSENSVTEFPIITKDAREIWVNQSATLVIHEGVALEFMVLAHDITKVKMAKDAVAQSEEKYRGIIENLELGILEVDNNDKVLKAYSQFCKLTGYSEEDLIGKSPTDLLLSDEGRSILNQQISERKKGNSGVYEIPIIKKDGSKAWVIISGAPFYNLDGKQMGSVGIHLDISHRKSIESELQYTKQKTEELAKVKELFLANISHEIRTPMNAIIGMAELLENSRLDIKQDKYVSAIRSSSKNLLVLVNDLLDFSKIESGKLTIEIIPFNLQELIIKTKELLDPKADENGVRILYDIDPILPKSLLADPTRLGQVLINLVGNAVKFTTDGNVYISAKQVKNNRNIKSILFEIKDEGIGIADSEMLGLFENFTQANQTTARIYGGTGLGLSISHKIVDLMGGKLEVYSQKGRGSTFYFTLELEAAIAAIELDSEAHRIRENFHESEILLVEDNPVNVLIAKTNLENWNCRVDVALNGKEAIDKLLVKNYNLVLMDMRMPIMGGLEATQIIRNKLKLNVPVVAVTGNAIKGDEQKYLKQGMDDYLSKPFEQIDLNKILIKWLNVQSIQEENLIDISSLNAMGDDDFVDRMIQLFIDESTKELNILEEAIQAKNFSLIKSTAHKMKPSIKYVCIERLYQDIRSIEGWQDGDTLFLNKTQRFVSNLETVIKQLHK
ncbi:MAG: PAS domain S-box-containing protein [Salibacteraceae bacterium]